MLLLHVVVENVARDTVLSVVLLIAVVLLVVLMLIQLQLLWFHDLVASCHTSDEDVMQYSGNDDEIQDSDIDGSVSVTTSSLSFYDDNPLTPIFSVQEDFTDVDVIAENLFSPHLSSLCEAMLLRCYINAVFLVDTDALGNYCKLEFDSSVSYPFVWKPHYYICTCCNLLLITSLKRVLYSTSYM